MSSSYIEVNATQFLWNEWVFDLLTDIEILLVNQSSVLAMILSVNSAFQWLGAKLSHKVYKQHLKMHWGKRVRDHEITLWTSCVHTQDLKNCVRMEEITNPDILLGISDLESDREICWSWLASDLRRGKGETPSICNYIKNKGHRQNALNWTKQIVA